MNNVGKDHPSEANTEAQNKASPPPDNAARPWTESENPFIAFRRYADEQVSSLLQSVMGLPSMAMQPISDQWLYFEDKNNKGRLLRKTEEDVDRDADSRADSHWTPRGWGSNRDEDFFGRWDARHRASEFGLNSFFDGFPMNFGSSLLPESMFSIGDAQSWALPYLLFSSYSPLHLERSEGSRRHYEIGFSTFFSSHKPTELDSNDPRWRDAFEDLLRVTNGQDMLDRSTESERSRQSADKWLRGLIQRGSLGENWRSLGPEDSPHGFSFGKKFEQNSHDRRDQDVQNGRGAVEDRPEVNEAETELDLYDRFLDDIVNAHGRYSHTFSDSPLMRLLDEERKRHMQRERNTEGSEQVKTQSKDWLEYTFDGNKNLLASQSTTDGSSSAESRVVSTMTRSVRRTLADGSISTKTVKTKRFADGREESDESVEVTPPPSAKNIAEQNSTFDDDKEDKDSRGGWFWSR